MVENENVKNRLICYISDLGISIRKFERDCGLSNGYVNNIKQGIQPDKLAKIKAAYPSIDVAWLMTGEKCEKKEEPATLEASEPTAEYGKAKDCLSCPWREQIAEKDRQIERLQGIIDTLIAKK